MIKLISKFDGIDISFILYLDMQKTKKIIQNTSLQKQTLNSNAYSYPNISNSIFIINKLIVYSYKTMPIKTRIQITINFLEKKKDQKL